jgi:hypothetical protein
MVVFGNLSWHEVNFMNYRVFDGLGTWVYGYLWGEGKGVVFYITCWVLARPCMCWGGMCIA